MCDCLTWHHPVWALVGKRAGVAQGIVWSVFSALREADPILARLPLPDRIRTLALGLGFKPAQLALVVASLQHSEVVDAEMNLVGEWAVTGDARDAVTVIGDASDLLVTSGDALVTPGDASPLARRRAVSCRSSAKYRAKLRGVKGQASGYPPTYPVTLGDAPQEEKEEADLLLYQQDAREREAQPVEYIRKERWATGVMHRAAHMLSQDETTRLWSDIMLMRPDRSLKNWGLPRRANDRLDRLDNLLTDHEAPKLPLGGGQLIGVEGGRGPPPVTGVTEQERLRRYHQRMTG